MRTARDGILATWSAGIRQRLARRIRRFPRKTTALACPVRAAAGFMLRGWLHAYHGLEVVGAENIPNDGSFIMVSNHASHLDTLCLLSSLPLLRLHRAYPAAAADYFFTAGRPRCLLGALAVNAVPFDRGPHVRQSLQICRRLLSDDRNVLILFPEGTRSRTGEIGPFRPGIGGLLAGTRVPVLPCFVDGTFDVWPKGQLFPGPGRVRLHIGAARTYEHLAHEKFSSATIADDLRNTILAMQRDAAQVSSLAAARRSRVISAVFLPTFSPALRAGAKRGSAIARV
jgi:1-acyl-sn-glycerol-3-phosphate acyltransferase